MRPSSALSTRWRVLAPAAFASAAMVTRFSAVAQDEDRHQPRETGVPDGSGALGSMLALLPASVINSAESLVSITFGDMAAQLAAGGIDAPKSIDDDEGMHRWINASLPIAMAEPFRRNAFTLGRDLIGFDVTDIDQSLEAGAPPTIVSLLRGRFDPEAVAAAWAVNGYRLLTVSGRPAASLFEKADIDLKNPISQIALSRMNNAAFLADGTLVYAPTLKLLTELIEMADGNIATVREDDQISLLLAALPDPLASAVIFSGGDLAASAQVPPRVAADEELQAELQELLDVPEPMPPIARGLAGMTPGGPTMRVEDGEDAVVDFRAASIVFKLVMNEPGTAERAASIVESRLKSMNSLVTGRPYSELYELVDASSSPDGNVLMVELRPASDQLITIWMRGLFARDLLFLAW